jgi:hypothetical protein
VDGTWRFSITAEPSLAALRDCLARRSLIENLAINLWLFLGRPDFGAAFDQMLGDACPEFASAGGRADVVLTVRLNDPTQTGGDSGITPAPTSIALERIAQTGDSVPDQPGATFTYFGNPLIDAAGRVAFYAAYRGGDGDAGLYVYSAGAIQRIFDNATNRAGTVPGGASEDIFGAIAIAWDSGAPQMAWGNDGRLIFVSPINESTLPDGLYRWRASDGDMLMLANFDTFRALFSDASTDFLPEFHFPGLSDTGIVHFTSRYSFFDSSGAFVFFNTGLYSTNGVQIQPLIAEQLTNLAVPGRSGATFTDFALIATHNTSGKILFQAQYSGGEGNRGVYLADGASISRIADNGSNIGLVGLPNGTTIGSTDAPFGSIALGERDDIAINTPTTVNGVTDDAVIYFNGTRWTQLTGQGGSRARHLLSGINRRGKMLFRAGSDPHIGDDSGSTRINAQLPAEIAAATPAWADYGGAINNQNRGMLRYRRGDSGLDGLAYWNGSRLLFVVDLDLGTPEPADVLFSPMRIDINDQLTRVGTVTTRPEINRPGISGTLNDRDELVLRIGSTGDDGVEDTTDDRQSIYIGRGQP